MISTAHYTIIKDTLQELKDALNFDVSGESDLGKKLVDEAILQRFAIGQHVILTALLIQAEKNMGDFDSLEALVDYFLHKELITDDEKELVITMIKLGYAITEYNIEYECKRTETVAVAKDLLPLCETLIARIQQWVSDDEPEKGVEDCCHEDPQHATCDDHCCQ